MDAERRASWVEVQRHPLWDAAGRSLGLLIVVRDVTARKQFEQELRAQSYRDRLTGLRTAAISTTRPRACRGAASSRWPSSPSTSTA